MKSLHIILLFVFVTGFATISFILINQSTKAEEKTQTNNSASIVKNSENVQKEKTSIADTTSCIITIEGEKYDVQNLRGTHEGGDIFVCDTDMSNVFASQHGGDLQRLEPYKIYEE